MIGIAQFFVVGVSLYLIVCSADDVADDANFVPMVAFLCRRPAMHQTATGWIKDEQIDCLTDPKDILEYCKHVYPNLDVRYVVEASDIVKISNWCKSGREKCSRHVHAVRPYRCLVKPFISDALLVPKNCNFDHIHESSQCKGYSDWDVTAGLSCTERGMFLKSFAMIQPCDVNKFAGTEFVCCPGNYNDEGKAKNGQITVVDKKQTVDKIVKENIGNKNNSTNSLEMNKNANYNKAKDENSTDGTHKKHAKKVSKVMNKPKHASTKNKSPLTITRSLTQSPSSDMMVDDMPRASDDQKEVALENYLKSLNEEPISVARVLSTLKKYMKIQQKEKIETIEIFKATQASRDHNVALVQAEKHLKDLDQATEEALQMLEKIPKHGKKMRQHMDDYIHHLPSIDESIFRVTSTPITPSGQSIYSSTGFYSTSNKHSPVEMDGVRKTSVLTVPNSPSPATNKNLTGGHEFEPIPALMAKNQLNVEQQHLKKISSKSSIMGVHMRHGDDKIANPVGIILTSIGLVLIVVIGIVALIKRVNSVPVTNGYLDRPTKRTDNLKKSSLNGGGSSVRRQNSMNGYENPTYRYFEAHVNP